MRRLSVVIACLIFVFSASVLQALSRPHELALQLHNLAQRCVARAKELPPGIAGADNLFLTARICAQGAEDLLSPDHHDKELVIRQVAALLTTARHEETAMRRGAPTDGERAEEICMHLPLESIIAMIDEEQLDLYLRPTPLQLTAKRMIFKLIIELFNGFGRRALKAQKQVQKHFNPSKDDESNAPDTGMSMNRFGKQFRKKLWQHLITERPEFFLRTLRIFANKYIDKVIPHPDQPQWHKPLEMFIPMALGHTLSYFISYGETPEIGLPEDTDAAKNTNKTKYNLGYEILADGLLRCAYNRFYCKEESKYYRVIDVLCWFLPFFLTDTSVRLWREANRTEDDGAVRPLRDRLHEYRTKAGQALPDIITEGVVEISIWTVIDDYIMPLLDDVIPQWLLATPVHKEGHKDAPAAQG